MRVLFDQGTPVPLRHILAGHRIATAYELGWSTRRIAVVVLSTTSWPRIRIAADRVAAALDAASSGSYGEVLIP